MQGCAATARYGVVANDVATFWAKVASAVAAAGVPMGDSKPSGVLLPVLVLARDAYSLLFRLVGWLA